MTNEDLTYEKRYMLSKFIPEKSSGGSRHYLNFFESNNLSEAKKVAAAIVEKDGQEVILSDKEKWGLDAMVFSPEKSAEAEEEVEEKPIPKHRRKK